MINEIINFGELSLVRQDDTVKPILWNNKETRKASENEALSFFQESSEDVIDLVRTYLIK